MRRERPPYRVTDIAAQAGLSRATVDRVLHGREGVRPETVVQIERAIEELDRQQGQIHLSSRALIFDFVMQAPARFATACQSALETQLRAFRPAVLRARMNLSEHSDATAAAEILHGIARRGSDGVILKAPDHSSVRAAIDTLHGKGIPTITFVTDVPKSRRAAYVGVDNISAGATAAYLIASWSGPDREVLVTLSHSSFHGEDERKAGFSATLARLAPQRRVHEVTDTDGLDQTMVGEVRLALVAQPSIDAVYSVGGGNLATVAAFAQLGRRPSAFIAHDLDADNTQLLRTRQISAVLHHDLNADLQRACRLLLQARGVLPGSPASLPSQVQVVTPFNEPPAQLDSGY
jgi:LacI family transcriptional regulator